MRFLAIVSVFFAVAQVAFAAPVFRVDSDVITRGLPPAQLQERSGNPEGPPPSIGQVLDRGKASGEASGRKKLTLTTNIERKGSGGPRTPASLPLPQSPGSPLSPTSRAASFPLPISPQTESAPSSGLSPLTFGAGPPSPSPIERPEHGKPRLGSDGKPISRPTAKLGLQAPIDTENLKLGLTRQAHPAESSPKSPG
ncbi:hypothetical protein K439DRAFT_1636581 [Ramaria rubella]|nr:hypothetical protein K439DRAFT_1636581 [Ramaria rubella]